MVPKDKKRGLGRGLSALMADVNEAEKVAVGSVTPISVPATLAV